MTRYERDEQALKLIRAFYAITDPAIRETILTLAVAAAQNAQNDRRAITPADSETK